MNKGSMWRLVSDYIGAGEFVVGANRAFLGTEYGVQCLPYSQDNLKDWKTELGSRCIGVLPFGNDQIIASCTGGVFRLSREGETQDELLVLDDLVYPAVLVAGGGAPGDSKSGASKSGASKSGALGESPAVLTIGSTLLSYRPSWQQPAWQYDLRKALGASVESVRVINAFELGEHFVAGVVDYDSGIGRVIVLDRKGEETWLSDPGPLSELFPAGSAVFVSCLTGYGKLETSLTRLDGKPIWKDENMAGVGTALPDGSFVLLVGSNESPRWDNWEYRHLSASGEIVSQIPLNGRCPVRPLPLDDGSLIVISSAVHLDPTSSRVDYTSFFKMPQEVLFQHLVGIREQLPEYEVFLHRVRPGGASAEIVYHATGSYSLAPPQHIDGYVMCCDGRDLLGIAID